MKKYGILLALLFTSSSWASTVFVDMVNIGAVQPQPNFFIFDVDGVTRYLLCDQFLPNVTTQPYTAMVATLDDLSGTALIRQGDSVDLARQKYTWIAILDSLAYGDPSLAPDVTRANRFIVDGGGPMTAESTALLTFAVGANPADYDLTGFRIFVGIRPQDGSFLDTQEITGHIPEPATVVLMGSALGVVALLVRRKKRASLPEAN